MAKRAYVAPEVTRIFEPDHEDEKKALSYVIEYCRKADLKKLKLSDQEKSKIS